MNEAPLTDRALKIIKYQRFALIAALLLGGFGVYYSFEAFGYHNTHWTWYPLFLFVTYISASLIFKVMQFVLVMFIYEFNIDLMEEESREMKFEGAEPEVQEMDDIDLTVAKLPEKPIAKYLDVDIWEWVEFTNDAGQKILGTYETTVDMTKQYVIDDDCVAFPPGVVYRLTLQE